MHMGPEYLLVNVSVQFRSGESTESIEQAIERVERGIKEAYPTVRRLFVEAERGAEAEPAPR